MSRADAHTPCRLGDPIPDAYVPLNCEITRATLASSTLSHTGIDENFRGCENFRGVNSRPPFSSASATAINGSGLPHTLAAGRSNNTTNRSKMCARDGQKGG